MDITLMTSMVVILLGLIIGSFLNVVIYRMPRDLSVVRPRSRCSGCEKPLKSYQNIPLLSYLFLRGKCANCGTPISFQYPLVEFMTALLFWFSWRGLDLSAAGLISQFRIWYFIAICIAIFFIDLEHRIIPDELSLGGIAVGALTSYFDFRHGMGHLLLSGLAGFGFFFIFAVLYEKVTGRVGLGGGDIKFMGTIGVFLGLGGVWTTLLLSSVIGSIVGIGYAAWLKHQARQQVGSTDSSSPHLLRAAIPYGPFLVLGALVELFFEVSVWMNG